MKCDRSYRRIMCKGLPAVILEVFLVSVGHNLYKLFSKQQKARFPHE